MPTTCVPLTPLEESLIVDDRASYPWNILYRLQFGGRLDRTKFEEALASTLARHWHLRSRVRRRWTQRFVRELAAESPRPRIHWNEHELGRWPRVHKLDAAAGETLEFWVRAGEAHSELLVHVHHVAVDGLGAVQFLGDLLTAYHGAEASSGPVAVKDASPTESPRGAELPRGVEGNSSGNGLRKTGKQILDGVQWVRQFLTRRPVPLVPHEAASLDQPLSANYPTLNAHTFTATETAALLASARQLSVSLNDLLLRDLFATLFIWRRERGHAEAEQWLRILVPMDVRTAADRDRPAANRMSGVFLDRREIDGQDAAALLRSLHDEMTAIKRNKSQRVFLLTLRVSSFVPGLIGWVARRAKVVHTAILSNLVRPFAELPLPRDQGRLIVAGLPLDSLEFFRPIRPHTCLAYGIATYAGRLTIGLHADSRFLAPNDCVELLSRYIAQLSASQKESDGNRPTKE